MTNADRIRAMSDAQLAEFLARVTDKCWRAGQRGECDKDCPMYECCNEQVHDNIEEWLIGETGMTGLKPCPFCGGEARLHHGSNGINKTSFVMCEGCCVKTEGTEISTRYSSDEKAIDVWNRRCKHD